MCVGAVRGDLAGSSKQTISFPFLLLLTLCEANLRRSCFDPASAEVLMWWREAAEGAVERVEED